MAAAFDWYQATIRENTDDVLEACMGLSERSVLRHTKGRQGYGTVTRLEDPEGLVAQVLHGGTHAYPHVIISGGGAQAGSELIRVKFPNHLVTRIDSRVDFAEPDAFDRITPVLVSAAQRHRVKVDTRGDHLLTKQGRSVYLGASSSAVQLREYDKAAELRSKFQHNPVALAEIPEYLTRVEVQVRPQTHDMRQQFATIDPLSVLGASAWSREVWAVIAGMELKPLNVGKVWRQSDDDRAYACMLFQYGPLIHRILLDAGSPECLGLQIAHDLACRDAAAKTERRGRGR